MAYRFEPGRSAASEFLRIGAGELDASIQLLTCSESALDERVHETRKHLKKLRALFALASGSIDAHALERETRALRKAAHGIADLRGQAALIEAFDKLLEHSADAIAGDVAAGARAHLERRREALAGDTTTLSQAAERLTTTRQRLADLRPQRDGWAALESGFRRTYARARRTGEHARRHPNAPCLHRFRTPAKRHFYQIQLLEPLWPELLHAQRKELSSLGDLLGDHHDLCLLLAELQAGELLSEQNAIEATIRRRTLELESSVFELERRLFAEKPRAAAARFGAYFRASAR